MYNSRARKKKAQTPPAPPCDVAGCTRPGEYRAPKQRGGGGDYYMFCLEHVREFNKNYDYFSGMEEAQVQAFMKDAVTGHRPTWRMGHAPSLNEAQLHEHLERFFTAAPTSAPPSGTEHLPPELREACALFEVTPPLHEDAIKRRYKHLAKLYHPDVNTQANAQERFTRMTQAYRLLLDECV